MSKYDYSAIAREISGFGGSYEAACRAMVVAGCEWFDEHPDARPEFSGFKGVIGIVNEDNDDARALTKAIVAGANRVDPGGPTGAMVHAAVQHTLIIRKNGWDWYVAEMARTAREETDA